MQCLNGVSESHRDGINVKVQLFSPLIGMTSYITYLSSITEPLINKVKRKKKEVK